ncbi:metal-dependent hydrolase [Aneurinibacillus thermoaerophilus]|uniref:metal-dependent hydrolase n=1 Tax=Aneurinibacillus thermoaerophilus TaxID=143495 RepID=UPI002E242E2B|nr:metal-dependent hydrolase [Aneurinibacillus thermoaerophilus]
MLGKTHFIAGCIAGYIVSPDWKGVLIGGFAGLLSDIDQPPDERGKGSILGRRFTFISYPLNKVFGHRTLTHSLLFIFGIYVACSVYSETIAKIIAAGILSHIVGDMLTGRVKLLWPIPWKLGIRIPELAYKPIDFIVRIALILFIIYSIWKNPDIVINLAFT